MSACSLVVLPLIRRYAYEVFLRTHLALSVSLMVGLWLHLSPQGGLTRTLLVGIMITFGVTTFFQWARQLWRNLSPQLQLSQIVQVEQSGNALFLEIDISPRLHFQAGQSVFITILTMHCASWLQSHPFVITWWDQNANTGRTHIHLMIRRRNGWTRRIMDSPYRLRDMRTWLDGPYGSNHDFSDFASVLFVASETGIFAVLPFLKDLTDRKRQGTARTRRVKVVVEMCEFHTRLRKWMDIILDESEQAQLVSFVRRSCWVATI